MNLCKKKTAGKGGFIKNKKFKNRLIWRAAQRVVHKKNMAVLKSADIR